MKRHGISYAWEALFCIVCALVIGAIVLALSNRAYPQCTGPSCPIRPAVPWRAAQPVAISNPAIVKVGYRYGKMTDYGSGAIVARDGKWAYVLTCWHTFRDGWPNGRPKVQVGKDWYAGVVKQVDRELDLAVIGIADPAIQPLALAAQDAEVGTPVVSAGCTRGMVSGRVHQTNLRQKSNGRPVFSVTGAGQAGDSGGPILSSGRIVGVCWGSVGGHRYATPLGPVRRFVRTILGCRPPQAIATIPCRPLAVIPNRPPPPTTPPQPSSNCRQQITTLEAQVELLWAEIRALKQRPTPAPALEPIVAAVLQQINLESLRGPPGRDGKDGVCDVGSLPPITVQVIRDGKIIERRRLPGRCVAVQISPRREHGR